MQVQVETYVDEGGAEKLRRFRFDSRVVEVADNIDQWHGADYRYVKVRGSDGSVYILRLNEARAEWELTMYQRSQSQGAHSAAHRCRDPDCMAPSLPGQHPRPRMTE